MLRQSSSRVHRSRGSKVKNVLQICFLVAVSLWLIYQVKHSHDKRKEFVENDASAQVQVQTTRLGRRDLPPRLEETIKNSDPKRDEEDETEEEVEGEGEGEDRKHDVEQEIELDGNNSSEEREDAISEHDLEKPDTEDDGEDILEEEKKRDEDGEKEKVGSSEGHDGNLGGTRNAHEAREELYKADDASSAVTQAIESTNNRTEDLTGKMETDNLQEEKEKNLTKTAQEVQGLKEENGEIAENGIYPNVTGKGEDHGNGSISSKSVEKLLRNSTATEEVVVLPESGKNSTEGEGSLVSDNLSLQNETDTKLDMNEAQNVTAIGGGGGALGGTSVIVQGQSSGSEWNNTQSDSNLLGGGAEAANSTISSEVTEPEKLKPGNGSVELESHSEVSTVEKPEITVNGTYDSSGTFHAENENLPQVESTTNSSISLEDNKNARADVNLGNLPETNSEGKEKDDPAAAAE